jgi:A/G-specific adenine glycosylase
MTVAVATVVVLRRGRVLAVRQPGGGPLALPGGKVEHGETTRCAAARELREETAIDAPPAALLDLELRIDAPGVSLHPFALLDPPPAAGRPELPRRWIGLERLGASRLAPGFARSVHAALVRAGAPATVPAALLDWWAGRRDALPWRATRDPYAVLVCEVMSQQTQIDRVREPWERWMDRWPSATALAAASLADVLRAWDGLGYPRRARDLLAAARRIAVDGWPEPDRLTDLPGVGPYTADAIRCFALELPVLPRDANVRRVLARRFPGGLAPGDGAWAVGGALMDLGRAHCRSRPRCAGCPLRAGCMVPLSEPGWDPAARPARQPPYAGSLRERRGALLRAALAGERPPVERDRQAAESLLADGLVALRDGALAAPASIVGGARCSS